MQIAIISDIHEDINTWDWSLLDSLPTNIDATIVAGDISNDLWSTCRWIKTLSERLPNVIWVAGNHDFYHSGFHQTRVYDKEFEKIWPYPSTVSEIYDHYKRWSDHCGVHFLNKSYYDIGDIRIVGATGWHDFVAGEPYDHDTQVKAWYNVMGDRHIRWNSSIGSDHRQPLLASHADADAIANMVSATDKKVIVVTHHIPDRSLLWQRPYDQIWTALHGSFANTRLESITAPNISAWIYGHTHQRGIKQIGHITYVCNARGYPGENNSWTPIVLEL